jgi:hypothetical protein
MTGQLFCAHSPVGATSVLVPGHLLGAPPARV